MRDLTFAPWAIPKVSPNLLETVCRHLYGKSVEQMPRSHKSRLNAIASAFTIPNVVAYFLFTTHPNNDSLRQAIMALRREQSTVNWFAFCDRYNEISVAALTGSHMALPSAILRQTIQSYGYILLSFSLDLNRILTAQQ